MFSSLFRVQTHGCLALHGPFAPRVPSVLCINPMQTRQATSSFAHNKRSFFGRISASSFGHTPKWPSPALLLLHVAAQHLGVVPASAPPLDQVSMSSGVTLPVNGSEQSHHHPSTNFFMAASSHCFALLKGSVSLLLALELFASCRAHLFPASTSFE